MNKTSTNGYYFFKIEDEEIGLHFSMNAWYNLKEDTGQDITGYGEALQKGTDTEKAFALAQIIYSAAKAYDQEEGNEINYNIYKVRSWFGPKGIDEKVIAGITQALLWNSGTVKTEKKPKGTVVKQK